MPGIKKTVRRVLGVFALVMAGFGLYYNYYTASIAITGGFERVNSESKLLFFYPIFTVMSAICVLCYLLLSWAGLQFLLGRNFSRLIFTGLMIFEPVFFFGHIVWWFIPFIGLSIGASTGVALGGLMYQFNILFPIWAPLLLWWTERPPKTTKNAEQVMDVNRSKASQSLSKFTAMTR